ncbi:MAG TPA: cytochrome c-type biogenesis protein CcmH [Pseudohongiella sp.]|nr:cytochrome c-type biogenesis protein CcmH [Pseudohongiella sp.]HEA63662.1 cytochrome c-type biogenesis protein CcmH [Pseudohongiella sp.]
MLTLVSLVSDEAQAAIDVYEFETVEQEQRFRDLSNEFRCPMCQNANLTSSPGGVAADLRREIYRMIMEGQTDQEIEAFMLARYGDFILYRPRLTMQTLLLWFGPLLFLLIGIWVAFTIMRRSGTESPGSGESLNADEEARLKKLLAQKNQDASDQA